MSLVSANFLGFVALLLVLYYGPFRRFQWQLLLGGSLFFYFLADGRALVYLLFTVALTYVAANSMDRIGRELSRKKNLMERGDYRELKKRAEGKKRKILIFTLLLLFVMLSIFKFSGNFLSFGRKIFPRLFSAEVSALALPLGISFYIFQSAGYLMDLNRNRYAAEKNFFKHALFVSYFPQMIQGPINRFPKLSPQLFAKHELDYDEIKYGLWLMVWGYMKKILIADRAALVVGPVFQDPMAYSGAMMFFAVLVYGIQIYGDFSGGIDIVRGVSQMLGIKMSINFRQPFFSTSIGDFWRRWHITLGSWLKDYVFYPLNLSGPLMRLNKKARKIFGNQGGKKVSIIISTYVIYFIVGIWHGAGIQYLAFGIWNGTLISLSLILEKTFVKMKKSLGIGEHQLPYRIFMIIRTNFLVCLGRFFTRAPNLSAALAMIRHGFVSFRETLWHFPAEFATFPLGTRDTVILIFALLLLFYVDLLLEKGVHPMKRFEERSAVLQVVYIFLAIGLLFFGVIWSGGYVATEFIYKLQ